LSTCIDDDDDHNDYLSHPFEDEKHSLRAFSSCCIESSRVVIKNEIPKL
jgi:hypothetical protein